MVTISDNKVNSSKKIVKWDKPEIVYIPLEDNRGNCYRPLVKKGDYVYKEDIVGVCDEYDFPICSSVSGYVSDFFDKKIGTGKLVKCLGIENDFKEKYKVKSGYRKNMSSFSKDEFVQMLRLNGIVGLSGNGFMSYLKYKHDIKYLVVNGAECEPYISCDNAIMYQHAEDLLEGIDAICEIMGLEKAYIAIKSNNLKIINMFLKYINSYPNIKVYPVFDYYPVGWEKNIVKDIFNIDYDKYSIEKGIVVSNVSTIYAIYEMLKYNKSLTERVITICGDGIKNPCNVNVKIGDVVSNVINNIGGYKKNTNNHLLITNGPLNGISHSNDDIVVTKDLTGIVVMENIDEKVYPCIKCGKCIKVCPAKIMPVTIMNNLNNSKMLKHLDCDKCISCGLCSYICPSHIEIKEFVKKAKERVK